jgi:hypothetical protein
MKLFVSARYSKESCREGRVLGTMCWCILCLPAAWKYRHLYSARIRLWAGGWHLPFQVSIVSVMVVNIPCCEIQVCCWKTVTIAVTLDPFIMAYIVISLLCTFFNISYSRPCMSTRWQGFCFPVPVYFFFKHITVFYVSSDATSDKVHPIISKKKVKLSQYRPVRL